MRKLTAICFAILITTSAVASPRNESKDRDLASPITRIVRQIKNIVAHILEDAQPTIPTPH